MEEEEDKQIDKLQIKNYKLTSGISRFANLRYWGF
jgi:hypothetical protein